MTLLQHDWLNNIGNSKPRVTNVNPLVTQSLCSAKLNRSNMKTRMNHSQENT